MTSRSYWFGLALLVVFGASKAARGQAGTPDNPSVEPAPAPAAGEGASVVPAASVPAPYSLPWQLRPAAVGTVVRSDTAVAFYEDPTSGNGGSTVASMLLVSYKLMPNLAPLVRIGVVKNVPPMGGGATSFVNPVAGVTYLVKLPHELRLALFGAMAFPVGMGGGNSPDAATRAASLSGIAARSAMDNAMFAVNCLTPFGGAGLAWVAHGLTVQAEVTVLQLFRVRGEDQDPEAARPNSTFGLHVGYFVIPELSFGAELRYQRWLSTPSFVAANAASRDTATFAIGIRGHWKLGESIWFRPGIVYARGLDDPMARQRYNIVQVDLLVAF